MGRIDSDRGDDGTICKQVSGTSSIWKHHGLIQLPPRDCSVTWVFSGNLATTKS